MLKDIFNKPTKWSVMRNLIFKEIDDLIIGSLGIVAFISFFVGGVVSIQTALNLTNPLIPKYLIGFATRQSVILEFAPTFISIIMAGKMGSLEQTPRPSLRTAIRPVLKRKPGRTPGFLFRFRLWRRGY